MLKITSPGFFYKNQIKFLMFISINFIIQHVLSQDSLLTYEDAVQIAVEQNVVIRQQKNQLKLNKAEQQQNIANYLPDFNATATANRTLGRHWVNEQSRFVTSATNVAGYSVGTNIVLFNGLRNYYSLKQTNQLYAAQKNQVEQSIQDVIFQTSQQFLQILLDKELLRIAEENLEVQKRLYNQIETYVKLGTRTTSELITQKAQLQVAEVNLIQRKNSLSSDKAFLARTLLFEPMKGFDIAYIGWNIDDVLNLQLNIDSLIETAKISSPELKRLEAIRKSSKTGIHLSRTQLMPNLTGFFQSRSGYSSGDTINSFQWQIFDMNVSQQFGFSLNIPIFNRLQARTNIVRSKIDYENSDLQYIDAEQQLIIDIQRAYQDLISFKYSYIANTELEEAAKMAFERQTELYQMGRGSLTELNIENQRYIQAQSERIQAEFTLLFQKIILDYHVGTLNY